MNPHSHSHESAPDFVVRVCNLSVSLEIVVAREDFVNHGWTRINTDEDGLSLIRVHPCSSVVGSYWLRLRRAGLYRRFSNPLNSTHRSAEFFPRYKGGTLFGNVCSVPAFQASRMNQPRFPRASARSSPGFHIVGFQPVIQGRLKTCAAHFRRLRQRSSGGSS